MGDFNKLRILVPQRLIEEGSPMIMQIYKMLEISLEGRKWTTFEGAKVEVDGQYKIVRLSLRFE